MRMLAVIGLLASVGCRPLAAQARSGGNHFTLTGTVVDGVSNRPLADVELSLQTEKWEAAGDPVVSDTQGRFAFHDLAAGEYILAATGDGFGTVQYGEAPDPGWVHTIRVAADKSMVFPIVPRSAIEGVVRDEFGDPMMRASVFALRPLWRDGRTTLRSVSQKFTDDRGRYRFAHLAPGSYVVCTAGSQTGSAPAPVEGPVDFAAKVDRFYTRTCYPASDRPFALAPGLRAQIDLAPLTATAATVRGRVRNVPAPAGMGIMMPHAQLESEDGFEGAGQNLSGNVDMASERGTFAFRGVPPGRYRLTVTVGFPMESGDRKQLTGEIPVVDVGGADIDGLEVTLDAGGAVDVAFHGLTENHIDPTTVSADLQADSAGYPRGGQRAENGSWHFSGLPAGAYWLRTRTGEEACVQSVKMDQREVRGKPIEIAAGAALHVDVTVGRNCGGIRARAVRDGEAVAGAKVVLLLGGTAKSPGGLMEDFANDEGELFFSGLTPGRYLLWAWAVEGKGAITGPGSLAAVEPQAAVVEVKEGEPVHVDVPLLQELKAK